MAKRWLLALSCLYLLNRKTCLKLALIIRKVIQKGGRAGETERDLKIAFGFRFRVKGNEFERRQSQGDSTM